MNVYEKIELWRKSNGWSILDAAEYLGISQTLYAYVLDGMVTSPKIAMRFKRAAKLSESEYNLLIPENRRVGTETYDPDKYITKIFRKHMEGDRHDLNREN